MSAAPGAVKAVAPPPKGDAAPAKGQGGGGAPPKAGSAAPAKGSAGGGRGSGNSTPKPTSSGSLRAVAPPNRSATAVQPGARPSTPPPVKPMPAGGSKNAKPAAKPLTPEQQRAQDLAKAARAKALMPVINLHSSHTVADEQAWGDLAQTKNLLQRGGDLFVGDGFARYDEARSKLQAVYDRGVNGQTSVADAKQQMAQLMGQYRQGHQEQMQGYRDRANVGSYTVVPVLRGLEMGSNASTAILVTMKTGSWQAGWAASMAKRTTQDFAIDWLYNKSPIAHFYDRGLSQYTVAPASEKRVVENAVGSLGDAIFGGTLTSVTAAVTAKLTPAIGTKLLGINVTEKLIPRIAGALAFPAGNLARTPTDLGGTWAQQQFAARDIEQQITELNNGHGAGREQVRSEQARAVEAQRGVYMQQFGAAVLREARAQLRQTHAQVPGLLDQETARIAQELKDPNSKLVQQGRTQFEQKKSELVEQAASSYDKKHIAAVQAGKKQIQDVHANTPKLLEEQLWSTIQSLPVAALTGWAFGAAPNSARPMTPAEIGSRNLLTRPLASAGQPLYTLSGKALLGETLISSVSSAANEVWASRFNGKPLTAENLISQTLSGAVNLPMVNEARVLGADKLLADTHLTPEPARAQTVEPASVQTATLRPEAAQAAVPEDPTMNRATLANETKLADGVFQRGNRVVLRSPELEVSLPPGWQFGPLAALEEQSGPGSGYISLTGHGALMPNDLREHKLPTLTKVPQGTRVVLLAPPGAVVGAKLGEAVNNRWFMRYDFETQKFLPIDIPFRVLEAGQSLPNYVISEPEGLDVPARTDIIAPRRGEVVLLSKTIQPNMGTVVINTCGYVKGAPTTQWSHLAFEPHRVLDRDRRLHGLPDTVINYGQPTDLSSAAGVSDALTFGSRARTDHPQRAEANTTAAPRLDPNGSLAHELFRQALETAPPSLYDVRGFESKDEAFAAVSRVLDEYNRLQQPHNGGIELTAAIFSITEGKTTSFHSTLVHKASVARDKDGKLQPVSLQVPAEVDARMVSKREAPDNAKPVERLRVPLPRNAVIVAMVHSHPLAGAVSPRAGPSQDDAIVLLERARTPAWGVDSSYIVERVQTPQGSVNVAMKLELKPAYWLAPDPRAIADGIGKGELDINDWVTLRYVQRPGDPPQSPVSLNVVSLDEASKSLRSHLLPHNVFGAAADSPHAPLIDWPFARSTEESTERQPSLQGLGIELPFLDRASRYAVAALRLPQTFVRRYGDNGLVSGELFRSMPTPRSADDHGAYLQEVKAWHRSLLTTLDFLLKHQRGGNEVQIADPVSGEPWSLREMVAGLRAELPRVQALGADSADHLQTATKLPKTLSPTLVVEPGPWHAENRGYKWDGKTHHVSPEPLDSPATRADEETALQDTNNQQSLQNDSKLPEASHARATLWTLSAEGAPQQVSQLPPLDPDHAYVMAVDFTGGAPKVGVLYGNDATVAGIRPAPLLRADSHRAAHRDVMRRLFPNTRADELQAVSKLVAVTAFAEGEGRLRLTFQSDFNFLPRHLRHAGHGSVNETNAGSTEHNRRLTPAATRLVAQVVADATGRNVFYAEPLSASKVAKLMDQPLFAMRGDELHDGPLVEVQPSQRSATPMPLVQRSTRPPRSAEEWRAAFNNARHLNEVRDAQGRTSIELELQAMAPHPRTALSALKSELGPDTVQALLDGFFLGHVVDGDRSADGLLGVSAAWRARMGQQPLSGDTLATLIGAIGNLPDDVTVHDFEHLAVGYGMTPVEEKLGVVLGAANHYSSAQTDAIKKAQLPLESDAGFAELVRSRTAEVLGLSAQAPVGTTRQHTATRLFDRSISMYPELRQSRATANRFARLIEEHGLLAHLNEGEKARVRQLISGDQADASIEAVLSTRSSSQTSADAAKSTLLEIDSIIQHASNRVVPESREQRLDLFSRELALQTVLVRHGFLFSEVDINQVEAQQAHWKNVSKAYRLGSIDFASEFPATYREVRAAVDRVLSGSSKNYAADAIQLGAALQLFEAPNSSDQAAPHPDTLRRVSLFKTTSQPTIGANGEPQARRALVLDPRGNPVPNGMGKEFLLTLPNAQGIETQVLSSDLEHPDVKSKLAQRGLLDPIVLRDGRVTNISSAKVEELYAKVQAFDGYLFIEMPPSPKGVLKPYYSFGELWALSQMTGREVAPMMNPGTGLPDDTTPGEPPTGFDLDPKQVREHLINEFDESTKRWYVSVGPTPRRVNGELVMNVTAPKGFYVPFHTHPNQTRAYPSGGDVRNARQALLANLSSMILPASPKVSPATIAPVFYGNDPFNRGHDVGRRPVLRSSIDANLNDVLTRERSLGPRPEVGAASTTRKFVLPPERTARQLIEQGFDARFVGGKLGGIVRELQRAGHGARGIVELSARSGDRYYFNIVNVDGQVRFIHPDRHRATPISVREALDPAFALRVAPQQIVAALGGRSPDGLRWSLLRTERRPFEAPRWSWPPQELGPGKGNLWRSLFRMPTAVPDAALGGSMDPLWPPTSTDLPADLLHRKGVPQSLTPEQQEIARKHDLRMSMADREPIEIVSLDSQLLSTRSPRSAADWRAAFNNARHLNEVRDAQGRTSIELELQAMAPHPRTALSALKSELGPDTVQALLDGFFLGHVVDGDRSADGLLGVSAAWRARMGQQPLSGDTLATLIGAIGNLSDGVAVHDFEHLTVGYGTTPFEERLGRLLGAAAYHDTGQTDALAAAKAPLRNDAVFADLVRTRTAKLFALGADKPLGTTRPVASLFDEHFSYQTDHRSGVHQAATRFLDLLRQQGLFAHLRPDELDAISRSIFGESGSASIESVLSSRLPRDAFIATTHPILASIESVIQRASNRTLPRSRTDMLSLFSRELALQTLLVRHGFRFSEVDINQVLNSETQWTKARDAHGLGSIDFAGEFTDTYQEVRTAVDHVLRAAPGDDLHGDERKSVGAFAPARKAPSVADGTPFAPPLAKPSLPDAAIRVHAGVSALSPEVRRALEGEPSRWAPATPQQQQSSPPDRDAPKGLRAAWARAVTKGVKTIEQARNAYLRELAAYYRSGVNPALVNRRAFLDGLLHGKTHAVEFIEIPGVLKPINDHVGHVAADKLLAQVLDTAADVARQHTRVTVYQLDALRLAVEGSKSDVSAFADAFEARMQKLELGYVAHGIRYANKAQDDAADPSVREGLPVVRAQLGASAAGSRKELLAQGVEALDRASERLKRPEAEGGELDPERGAHLLKLKQTTAAANDEPLSAKDPGLDPELQPKDDERRATQQLSAAMLAALHEQTERVIGADPAQLPAYKRAIEDLVTKAFSTDDAFGRHLGNQLAFDRAVGERAFRFVRTLHGFIDVGAVGVTNRLVSRFGGDAVLTVVHATADKVAQRINQRMGLAGGKALEVFAVGGDEIRFISSELHVLRRFEKAFALAMRHATIDGTAGNTPAVRQPVQLSEIPVYIGVGKTKEEAEARSNAAKAGDPQRVPGRLPPSYVVGLTEQDMPWAKPPTPLPADIASADPAQLYRTDSSALSRLFAHGLSHPGATWHLVNSKDLPLARVTFDESGVAAYQRLERGGWTAAANLDHDHFVRLPERLGELFVSVDPVPPAWSPRLQKIDPAALPRGNASGLIDSATAFDRVLENAWLHRNMVASPRFRWELLTPNGQPSRSLDLARLQQQIELLAERSPGSEEQHGMGWQEFRNPGHQGGVTTFQIYASVQPDSAALVAREILDAAPAIGGLEGFKVARDEVKTALPANLMLYVSSQRGLHDVVSALRQIQSRHPEAFLQSSQAFAQEQLLPGVGYAQALDLPHRVIARRSSLETPTAMRFALVKRALQEVMQEGGNEADFRARLEQLLIEHNIDPQAPHLNLYNRGPRAIDMATFDPDALTKMPNLDAAARLQEELDAAAETLRANGHVAEASRLAAQAIVVRQALRNEQAARALRAGDVRNMLSPRDDSAENNAPQASDQSLRGADLSGRNLGGMNLSGADLRYANLHRSNLFGMDLHGANFTGANLADAGLSRADLGNANLTAANIGGAMLHLARLEDATLNNANLGGVQMKRAVLRGASADGADWSNADLHKSDFSNARLRSARLSDAQLGYVSFEGADLTGADIRGSEFYLPTMNLQSAKLEGLQADPRVLANLRRGAPPLEGVTLLKFHSDHTAKLVTRSASALPTLEQGGYLVVVAVPEGKGMQDGTVLMAPTSNALWNGDQRPPGAERKPQASHRVLAQNGVFQALSKDSVVLGATLMPEPPTDTVMGSAPRYRLSTQSWSVNSLINGYLGTRRIDPVVIDSSKPDIRPNDVYLPAEVSQPLAERLERDLGILITHLDGHPRHTALTHVAPPNDKQALQPLIDAGLLKNGTITADGVNRLAQARRELATEVGVDARAIELKVAALKIGQDHWHALIGRNAQAVDREHSYRSQLVQAMAPLNRDNAREQIGATSDSARQTQ